MSGMSDHQNDAAPVDLQILRLDSGSSRPGGTDFRPPWFVADSAWLGHLPFADWLVHALRPARIVELGVFKGTSFLAFCHTARNGLSFSTRQSRLGGSDRSAAID